MNERSRNRRALHLAAAELMHEMPRARHHADEVEQLHGEGFDARRPLTPASSMSGRLTFSNTFIVGNRLKNWNTMPRSRRR